MQGPERYLETIDFQFDCPVNRGRHAVLDSTLRVMVNHDVFFFSDAKAKAKFEANPLRYCAKLTDVVSRVRFAPSMKSPRTRYHGRLYVFAADSTLAQFQALPDSFAVRKGM